MPTQTVRRRPTPVTILAVFQAIGATGYLLSVAILDAVEPQLLQELASRGLEVAGQRVLGDIALTGILFAMAVIGYAAAFLLFRMQRLGWTFTMLLAGWSLASQIYLYMTAGDLTPGMLLINVIIVLYLNQREVRAAFGIGAAAAASDPELDERA